MKMMVMVLAGSFIKRSAGRVVDFPQPAFLHQQFQIAIHCRLIQRINHLPCGAQDFISVQGAVLFPDHLLDGVSLGCSSFYHFGMSQALQIKCS